MAVARAAVRGAARPLSPGVLGLRQRGADC